MLFNNMSPINSSHWEVSFVTPILFTRGSTLDMLVKQNSQFKCVVWDHIFYY